MMKNLFAIAAALLIVSTASAQTANPIKSRIVYDTTDPNSSAVVPLLIQKIAAQPKFFTLVNNDEKDLAIIADCFRDSASDTYSCFYAASKWLGGNQAFLGGAVVVKKSADDAAQAMFSSILQDVVERWNKTDRQMLIVELETCLTLTESSCAVPLPLIPELKVKSINLSQYMRSGGLKP